MAGSPRKRLRLILALAALNVSLLFGGTTLGLRAQTEVGDGSADSLCCSTCVRDSGEEYPCCATKCENQNCNVNGDC